MAMDRSSELRVKGHLYEIESVNDEVLGTRQGLPSAIDGYRKTLESVAEATGAELVDDVAADIKEHIRSEQERPANHTLRRETRLRLADEGIVPPDYLNKA